MRTQHNFCTQQVRYVGITRIVILFGLNLCAESRENSFQEVLKAVLFGGWSIPPTAHGWLLCGSPIRVSTMFIFICGVDIVRIGTYIEQCVSLVILFWGEVGKFCSPRVVLCERDARQKSESRHGKSLRDGCACVARVKFGIRNVRRVHLTDI